MKLMALLLVWIIDFRDFMASNTETAAQGGRSG